MIWLTTVLRRRDCSAASRGPDTAAMAKRRTGIFWPIVCILLFAAAWPTGLLPFGLLFFIFVNRQMRRLILVKLTRRFSAMSLVSVAILAATGIVNSCYLAGIDFEFIFDFLWPCVAHENSSVPDAWSRWGRLNLFWLKPRLTMNKSDVAGTLQFTVTAGIYLWDRVVLWSSFCSELCRRDDRLR